MHCKNYLTYFWETQNMKLLLSIGGITIIIVCCTFLYVEAKLPVQTAKVRFKLSGRNLIDKDGFTTTDGYVEVYYTNDEGRTMRWLGRSETIFDKRNPDWESIFEFHFDRKLRQYWFFHVYDEDSLALDDTVGKVWVNVADFMDKNQVVHANLDKGGYLTVRGDTVKPKTPLGILPFPRGTPNSKKLRFIVTSRGLDSNLNNHETLIITSTEGVNGAEKNLGKSVAITASLNPGWKQVFTLNWNKNKDQRLHFKIYDGKGHKLDDIDKTGDAWIEVNDYVAKGESFTVLLPSKGKLTMTKV